MSSSNKTSNYQLNQWSATDQVKRTDFNADNQKIDAALNTLAAGQLHIVAGSYTGNGTFGKNNPNSLTFSFQPKLVIIAHQQSNSSSYYMIAIRGQTQICPTGASSTSFANTCTWTQNGLSWYHSNTIDYQFNSNGRSYCYIAIG